MVCYRWSILTNPPAGTASEIWRVTGRKSGFYLPHITSPKFDKVTLQIFGR